MKISIEKKATLLYFSDPMCSWCWGISPTIHNLRKNLKNMIDFQLIMEGLRPGGGDPWNLQFKDFLKEHWEHVNQASGQPFGYKLFDLDEFNYDTEPPSRAVVIIREIDPGKEWSFLNEIQYQFYVENKDPGEINFYKSICGSHKISFELFKSLFEDIRYKDLVFKTSQLQEIWASEDFQPSF